MITNYFLLFILNINLHQMEGEPLMAKIIIAKN